MSLQEIFNELSNDKLLIYATPIFIVFLLLELFIGKNLKLNLYETKDTFVSLSMGVLSLLIELLPKAGAFIIFSWLHEISPLKDIIQRQWWAWVILFFADDFSYYWFHRLNHEVRILWAGHVPHHSSVYLNFATALRQGVGERIHKYIFWVWIPLLGFDPLMMFTMMSISLIYQFFIHTELITKFPKTIEFIFNTPSHHRVHHASNVRYLDRNHAGVLIIWDRVFGTFSKELKKEKPIYGLTTNIKSYNPIYVAGHEYISIWKDVRKCKKLIDKLKYIFYPPGWSHIGDNKTSKTLRNQK